MAYTGLIRRNTLFIYVWSSQEYVNIYSTCIGLYIYHTSSAVARDRRLRGGKRSTQVVYNTHDLSIYLCIYCISISISISVYTSSERARDRRLRGGGGGKGGTQVGDNTQDLSFYLSIYLSTVYLYLYLYLYLHLHLYIPPQRWRVTGACEEARAARRSGTIHTIHLSS